MNECDGLLQCLEGLIRNAERQGRIGVLVEALVLSAMAHERLGESLAALLGRAAAGEAHAHYAARIRESIGLPQMGRSVQTGGPHAASMKRLANERWRFSGTSKQGDRTSKSPMVFFWSWIL